MKTKHKGLYEPPTSSVVEMNMQGVLCWSEKDAALWLGLPNGSSPTDDGIQNYTVLGNQNW